MTTTSEKKYDYKPLIDLPKGKDAMIYLYAVISGCSFGANEGVVTCTLYLMDGSVESPVPCKLKFGQLIGEMEAGQIIRIHRIKSENGEGRILSGRLGDSGLQVAGFSSDPAADERVTVFRSSENFTLCDSHGEMIRALRKWNAEKSRAPSNSTVQQSAVPETVVTPSAETIPKFVSASPTKLIRTVPNEVVNGIRSKLLVLKQMRKPGTVTEFSSLQFNYKGNFYDVFCEVISVLKPLNDDHRAVLRVCDGTCTQTKCGDKRIYQIANVDIDEEGSKMNTRLEESLQTCTVDITCYDEFADMALNCDIGDIVKITNIRAAEKDTVHTLNLNGAKGNQARYNRGIAIVQKGSGKENQERQIGSGQVKEDLTGDSPDGGNAKKSRLDNAATMSE